MKQFFYFNVRSIIPLDIQERFDSCSECSGIAEECSQNVQMLMKCSKYYMTISCMYKIKYSLYYFEIYMA